MREMIKLTDAIIKTLPKFFGDFDGWEYADGVPPVDQASRDFKKIYDSAKRINKRLKCNRYKQQEADKHLMEL